MTKQHHEVIRCLLQQMTDRYLTSVPGFAEVMRHYNITTKYVFDKHSPHIARLLKEPRNFVADIHTPEYPDGVRHEFATESDRNHFLNELMLSAE